MAEFLRTERVGILNMEKIAMKPPVDRDENEKQFFVMHLKLRVPFFSDFDKKTLKLATDRMLCNYLQRNSIVKDFDTPEDTLYVVLEGRIGRY